MGQTGPPLRITLQDALARARTVNPLLISATLGARIAHEDTVQAKAAMLPQVQGFSQFIYTQPNGTPTGHFRLQRRAACATTIKPRSTAIFMRR